MAITAGTITVVLLGFVAELIEGYRRA